jgi:hypothetical protein
MEENNNRKIKTAEKIAKLEERLDSFIKWTKDAIKYERDFQEERYTAVQIALKLARSELDKRLESMNEFRRMIEGERATYVTEKELELRIIALEKDIKPLEARRSFNQGRDWAFGVIIVAVCTAIALAIKFLG